MEEERQAAPDSAGAGPDAARTSPDDAEPSAPLSSSGPAGPISVAPGVAAARASVPGALRPSAGAVRAATWPSGESKIYGARPAATPTSGAPVIGEAGTKRISGMAKVPSADTPRPDGRGGGLASIAEAEEPWSEAELSDPGPQPAASEAAEREPGQPDPE